MPTNKTHTSRIEALESQVYDLTPLSRRMKECEDEQANHDVSIEDLHTRLTDIERKFPDLKEIKTHIDSLYQGLLDVDTRVTKQIDFLKEIEIRLLEANSIRATYQITNEKNVTLLFERMDNAINIFTDLHNRLNHVERTLEKQAKKNTKTNIIPNIVKVGVGILFTTFN